MSEGTWKQNASPSQNLRIEFVGRQAEAAHDTLCCDQSRFRKLGPDLPMNWVDGLESQRCNSNFEGVTADIAEVLDAFLRVECSENMLN